MSTALPSPILSLTNVVLTSVKPLRKTAHVEAINPTFLDLVVTDAYMPTFAAYRLNSKEEEAYMQLVNQIKGSLEKVLVPFFPFAGRWIKTLEGSGRQLLCNDEGVPFIEAYVDKDLESVVWASDEFQPVPELQGYGVLGLDASQFTAQMPPDGLPAIFVQMTRFKSGGVVLAVTFNHMLVDGKGFFDFMGAWSDLSRTNQTAFKPDHNRASAKSFEGIFPMSQLTLPETKKLRPWAMKTFEVSAASIQSTKQEVKESAGGAYVSTVDCVTAHTWKNLARLPSAIIGGREVSVPFTVEGRSRFYDPPLPNLCGNVYTTMVCPKIPSRTLLENPLSLIARKIREKILATSKETWLSVARAMETNEAYTSSLAWPITPWFHFPMYDIDFGVGKPFFASGPNYMVTHNCFGMSYIGPPIPGRTASAATVSLWSTPEVLEALESQPGFFPFFLQHDRSSAT